MYVLLVPCKHREMKQCLRKVTEQSLQLIGALLQEDAFDK